MITLNNIKAVYFIGIGGIGMSALARYFHARGVSVSGYDKTSTPLTKALEQSGMVIHYETSEAIVPKDIDLVVYTPAIPANHVGLKYYQQNGYPVLKRSEVLEIISAGSYNICIAGTHGKTTITTMTAHLLRDSGYGANAFLGGISVNYQTNFWSNSRNLCVIEADEYDRSFLKLSPDIAVISSMDADHLDIYGTEDALQDAFVDFSKKIKSGGLLISKKGLVRESAFDSDHHITYSLSDTGAGATVINLTTINGSYFFDVIIQQQTYTGFALHMGGLHNVENMLAAISVCTYLGIEAEKIKVAVANFKGVRRRFEYVIKNENLVLIDDYAHHPEELKALINGARNVFKGRKCTVIFQPHLFSRTKDQADGFSAILSVADEVILLPIYPARELPMEGVTSDMLLQKMDKTKASVLSKDAMLDWVKAQKTNFGNDIIIMAGAGDIDALVLPVKEILES